MRLLALLCLALAPAARGADLEALVRSLDAGRESEWTGAFEGLKAAGEPAAERVLRDFAALDFGARRARARLLVELPFPAQCPRVLDLVGDPDPQVRRLLASFLGNPALAAAEAPARVAALARMAQEDASAAVRAHARAALVDCALPEAVPALDRAIERLPAAEAEGAARALAELPGARERLIARVRGEALASLPARVQAALLGAYGKALAEVPGGGETRAERLPFLMGRVHPCAEVSDAARKALATFVARASELSDDARAESVLTALADEGWPRVECLRRRFDLAWLRRGDPAAALTLARALARAAALLSPSEAEAWELHARVLEGAALYALDEGAASRAIFDELTRRLEDARARREDLFPGAGASEPSEAGGAAYLNRLHLAALVHLWRALLELSGPDAEPRVLGELRQAHALYLQSRVVAMRSGADDPSTLDALLDSDLSPHTLVLFNEHLAPERRDQALDRALALGTALGRVAPLEMLGFETPPPEERALGDVFVDPERLQALEDMREADRAALERRLRRLDEPPAVARDAEGREQLRRILRYQMNELQRAELTERQALTREGRPLDPSTLAREALVDVHRQLLDYLTASMHAHRLAAELRTEGRTREARALCERALATLRTAPLGNSVTSEFSSARFELMLGSLAMDDARPADAEQGYLAGERRLASIEKTIRDLADGGGSPDSLRQYEAWLKMIREQRGESLLALAVNANVRQHDPERALGYFERAYELNPNPFMRILRACYRARSGKVDEARTVLASVVPSPSLYYNIACTHALLGEKDLALDFLDRDLAENHPTAAARAQKLEWARKDPDLANLRGDARFEQLLAGGR